MPLTPEEVFPWKLRLFFAGAIFLLIGMYLDRREPVIAAIVVLAIAVLLRFVGRKPKREVHPSWYEDEQHNSDGDTEAQR
jgi:hypothetical protein